MSDLFSWADQQADEAPSKAPEVLSPAPPKALTVSELNKQIKSLLEGVYPEVLVEGEISNFKPHSSGHFYFSLKDSTGQISVVMFRGANSKLKFNPQDGLKVLVRGAVSVYPQRGQYQIIIQSMEPMGEGALRLAFEQMKARLQAEGLFAPAHKRALPKFPRRIALVTSPTGAAIRDMLHVMNRRFPRLHITIFPVRVQGDQAASEIAEAIDRADKLAEFDVMIVGRGGGSLEDLWPFNEEIVARALYRCKTPTISAVGHEVDFTIADFVADVRAPTPSAAAEIAVPNEADLIRHLLQTQSELGAVMRKLLAQARSNLTHLNKALINPRRAIQDGFMRLGDLSTQLTDWIHQHLQTKKNTLARHTQLLDSLSPLAVLKRGYSIVTRARDKKIIAHTSEATKGDTVSIRLSDGDVQATIN